MGGGQQIKKLNQLASVRSDFHETLQEDHLEIIFKSTDDGTIDIYPQSKSRTHFLNLQGNPTLKKSCTNNALMLSVPFSVNEIGKN